VTPVAPDEAGCEVARSEAEGAKVALATINATLEAAKVERDRASQAVTRSSALTGEGNCPLCGQALGDAFEAVQSHRAEELVVAERSVVEAELDRHRAGAAATAATETASALATALRAAREAWAGIETARARRADAEAAVARAEAAYGRPMEADGQLELGRGALSSLSAEVERRRRAADECHRVRGRIERRSAVVAELDVERAAAAEVQGRLDMLRDKVMSLAFRPDELAAAQAARDRLRVAADAAASRAREAGNAAGQARVKAVAERRRLTEAIEQHAKLETLGEDARHLSRLADLLNAFRNTLVASVGPWLSSRAAELFAELTNREYDQLEINPETYEIKIRDAGLLYGMSRFSGSETDLANLALRVAVSEHVRFQAGAAVGLLVLDEVFGPLDDDRKELMLLGLERLKSRFRQILVVTHDVAIKEQLPSAIEVLKLPGRRASARLLYA
ncbi:MAG: repair protein SbcC/Rad50, partial [Actinomycetota bacterium]|nr:repair protein SbcC/Rad50 [Actinomycetota bacterium]